MPTQNDLLYFFGGVVKIVERVDATEAETVVAVDDDDEILVIAERGKA